MSEGGAIGPMVAWADTPVTDLIKEVNLLLMKPWSSYERRAGRGWNAGRATVAEREVVQKAFRKEGWSVRNGSDQAGVYLWFKPGPKR